MGISGGSDMVFYGVLLHHFTEQDHCGAAVVDVTKVSPWSYLIADEANTCTLYSSPRPTCPEFPMPRYRKKEMFDLAGSRSIVIRTSP